MFDNSTVISLKSDISIKRTPHQDGHLLEVPAKANRKCYMFVSYKTDTSLRRTADTISLPQTHKTLERSGHNEINFCLKTMI